MEQENIKTKVDFYLEGQENPFTSTENYDTLKKFFFIDENSEFETIIEEVKTDKRPFEIKSISISIL